MEFDILKVYFSSTQNIFTKAYVEINVFIHLLTITSQYWSIPPVLNCYVNDRK